MKHLISIKYLNLKEINSIFAIAQDAKKNRRKYSALLAGKNIALIFQKPSLRTRVSFEVGIRQLGGNCVYLGCNEINLGVREAVSDVAKTLSRYVDGIVLRTFAHEYVVELAKCSSIPVINGLSDLLHPCQALSDIFTIKEKFRKLSKVVLSFVGDGNNVCNSLLYLCASLGMTLNIACPENYAPQHHVVEEAKDIAKASGAKINISHDADLAVKDADVVYTDVWTSMGQEAEKAERLKAFNKFQINEALLALANKDCLVMHCLPAHRGEEITDAVLDGKNSIVFDQAENRLHVQKAILIKLFK